MADSGTGSRSAGARKPGQSTSSVPWLIVAALVALVVSAAIVIVTTRGEGSGGEQVLAGVDDDGGVAHVHGLGINPADDTLYAATHMGLFEIPDEGRASRIGESSQDIMGFTVVGEDRFLASGHPNMIQQPNEPPLLGLIESADGGMTWESVSLRGDADFHSLTAAHDRVYGYDSTTSRLLVSEDNKTWDERSTLRLASFAVDPADPDRLVASTEEGVVESTDGGRTWDAAGGPLLVYLAWDETGGLWGVGPEGEVFHDPAADGSWEPKGTLPGQPQALLVTDDELYAAATVDGATGIYRSDDGAATWELRYQDEA